MPRNTLLPLGSSNVFPLQIYDDSLGTAGEQFGPLSSNAERKLRELDDTIMKFLVRIREVRMDKNVSGNYFSLRISKKTEMGRSPYICILFP